MSTRAHERVYVIHPFSFASGTCPTDAVQGVDTGKIPLLPVKLDFSEIYHQWPTSVTFY